MFTEWKHSEHPSRRKSAKSLVFVGDLFGLISTHQGMFHQDGFRNASEA
jgi:hypothetical protein